MKKDGVILIAEDDDTHFELIKNSLQRTGILNDMVRFENGQQLLDFLFETSDGPKSLPNKEYLLILDLKLPGVDGIQILEKINQDTDLKKIPVIILTAVDEPNTIKLCHKLGCSVYIVKPVGHESFVDAVKKIGLFLSVVETPMISKTE